MKVTHFRPVPWWDRCSGSQTRGKRRVEFSRSQGTARPRALSESQGKHYQSFQSTTRPSSK